MALCIYIGITTITPQIKYKRTQHVYFLNNMIYYISPEPIFDYTVENYYLKLHLYKFNILEFSMSIFHIRLYINLPQTVFSCTIKHIIWFILKSTLSYFLSYIWWYLIEYIWSRGKWTFIDNNLYNDLLAVALDGNIVSLNLSCCGKISWNARYLVAPNGDKLN